MILGDPGNELSNLRPLQGITNARKQDKRLNRKIKDSIANV